MSNYVKVEISFKKDADLLEVASFLKKFESKERVFDFEKLIPMPDHIFRGNLGKEEMEKYGKDNWWDWSFTNWGTQWNAMNCGISVKKVEDTPAPTFIKISFWTAGSFPLPIIQKLEEMAEEEGFYSFTAQYADEEYGYNTGIYEDHTLNEYYPESEEAMEMAAYFWGPIEDEDGYDVEPSSLIS